MGMCDSKIKWSLLLRVYAVVLKITFVFIAWLRSEMWTFKARTCSVSAVLWSSSLVVICERCEGSEKYAVSVQLSDQWTQVRKVFSSAPSSSAGHQFADRPRPQHYWPHTYQERVHWSVTRYFAMVIIYDYNINEFAVYSIERNNFMTINVITM